MQNKVTLKLLAGAAIAGLAIGLLTNHLAKAQSPGINSNFNLVWSTPVDSLKRTYSGAFQLSPAGQATDISTLCGAAGLQIKLARVSITGRATAVSPMDIYLLKRSNWDVLLATQASAGGVPYDSGQSASRGAVTWYTTNPTTLGTLVGSLGVMSTYFGNLTTGTSGEPSWTFDYQNRPTRSPTLNSATECLAINLSGTSQGGNLLDVTWEWTEEP